MTTTTLNDGDLVNFRDDFSPALTGIVFTVNGPVRYAPVEGREFVQITTLVRGRPCSRMAWVTDLRPAAANG